MTRKPLKNFENLVRSAGTLGYTPTEDAELHPFDERNIHPAIVTVSKRLFDDGHYAQATFEAYKYIDKEVQKLSKLSETGFKLMMQAFSESSPSIKLTDLSTASEIDEQKGYQFIFAGSVMAIRNPRGHEYAIAETPDECLDHLSLASLLKRRLDRRIT